VLATVVVVVELLLPGFGSVMLGGLAMLAVLFTVALAVAASVPVTV
jgi:hypothetical protein